MSDPTHDQIEPMLWMVHDKCMSWLTDHRERSVPTNERIDRLILAVAGLAKALAGGYRPGGYKGE